jgi:hypothetical protein
MLVEKSTSLKNLKESIKRGYFEPVSNEEDYPIEISEERIEVCKKLEEIFDKVYDEHSLSIAKVILKFLLNLLLKLFNGLIASF